MRMHAVRSALLLPLFAGAVFLACTGTMRHHGSLKVTLDRSFDLEAGKQALIKDTGLVVRFASVIGDSRCPKDVTCVWEGSAEVAIDLVKTSGSSTEDRSTHTMKLATGRGPSEGADFGYAVHLLDVRPYPRSAGEHDWSVYSITLKVTAQKN